MFQFISFLGYFLRGKSYFGDFIKTLTLGFISYLVGFLIISIQIIIFALIGIDGQGVAILYYVTLMPIVLLPIMVVYFLLLFLIRFFFGSKNKLVL